MQEEVFKVPEIFGLVHQYLQDVKYLLDKILTLFIYYKL